MTLAKRWKGKEKEIKNNKAKEGKRETRLMQDMIGQIHNIIR